MSASRANERLAREMASECLMLRSRLVARMVTSVYEDALRPFGIKGSQLNLLAAIAYAGIVRRTEIGRVLHLDPSTLTRNLRVMETNGWIENVPDENDGRGSPLRVSADGSALIERVAPAWKAAQRRASRLLGSDAKAALMELSSDFPPRR